jgi:hypothetical protein
VTRNKLNLHPKGQLRADVAQLLYAILEQEHSTRDILDKFQQGYSRKDKAWLQEMLFGA